MEETASLERTVAAVASQMLALPDSDDADISALVERGLAHIGSACDADRAHLLRVVHDTGAVEMVSEWCAPGIDPVGGELSGAAEDVTRWWSARVLLGEPLFIADLAALEPEDEPAQRLLRAKGIGSLLLVPLTVEGTVRGAIGISTVGRTHELSDDVAAQLRLVGQTIVHRLALIDARTELERSNRDLEDFAYIASHDLKSPLLVVRGFLELLARHRAEELGEEGMVWVEAATRGADRMTRLIDALLAFSRAGRGVELREDVPLGDVVERVVAEVRAVAGDDIDITVAELPKVHGDPVQLAQLFQNVIDNAVKHASPDRAPIVRVSAERRDDEVWITVADNGDGIAPDDVERVFLMFTRLARSHRTSGSGIGLAICQRVVQAHGGRIWVEPNEPTGCRFVVALPA